MTRHTTHFNDCGCQSAYHRGVITDLRTAISGAIVLLELLRTGKDRKGREVKYGYVESRGGSMVKVGETIEEFRSLIAKAEGRE